MICAAALRSLPSPRLSATQKLPVFMWFFAEFQYSPPRAQTPPTCHPERSHNAGAEPERRNDGRAAQVKVTCHPERGVGVRVGAKDRRAAHGSAPRFVRRSFARTLAPPSRAG